MRTQLMNKQMCHAIVRRNHQQITCFTYLLFQHLFVSVYFFKLKEVQETSFTGQCHFFLKYILFFCRFVCFTWVTRRHCEWCWCAALKSSASPVSSTSRQHKPLSERGISPSCSCSMVPGSYVSAASFGGFSFHLKWSYDPRSYERSFSNCVEKPEKFRTSTGFEPVTSRYRCDTLTKWAMKQLTLGAGHLWIQVFPWWTK